MWPNFQLYSLNNLTLSNLGCDPNAIPACYVDYENALKITNLKTLAERREELCLRFAQSCIKNEKAKDIFPLNNNVSNVMTRKREIFEVTQASTERLRKSAVPYMQRLLNSHSY